MSLCAVIRKIFCPVWWAHLQFVTKQDLNNHSCTEVGSRVASTTWPESSGSSAEALSVLLLTGLASACVVGISWVGP